MIVTFTGLGRDAQLIVAFITILTFVVGFAKFVAFPLRRLDQMREAQLSRNGGGSLVDKSNAVYGELFEVDAHGKSVLDANGKVIPKLGKRVAEIGANQAILIRQADEQLQVGEDRHAANLHSLHEIQASISTIEYKQAVGEAALVAAYGLAPVEQQAAAQAAALAYQTEHPHPTLPAPSSPPRRTRRPKSS